MGIFWFKKISDYSICMNRSRQILMAVAAMRIARIHLRTFVFIFWPAFAPIGAAIRLATIMMTAGQNRTCPVNTLPAVEPIDEMNVIASDVAIVIRVGMLSTVSMIGTSRNEPAA